MNLPVPQPTATTRPFWAGLREGRIRLQYSPSARQWVFYPRVLAPGTLPRTEFKAARVKDRRAK